MYKPKHEKPVKGLRKYHKSGILVVSLILLLTLTVGGTVAYLMDVTGAVKNVFNPASVDINVVEDFDGETKSSIVIENKGKIPVYVRATLAIYWVDSQGVIVEPDSCTHSPVVIADKWITKDGIYYYPHVLDPGEPTPNLLKDSIKAESSLDGSEYHLVVEVLAEAIQAQPETAVIDAWGFVPGGSA